MRRSLRAVLLASAALLAAGCAAQSAKPVAAPAAPAAPSCTQPPDAVLPHTAGSLSEAESGVYCLAVGDRLSVFLTAQQNRWTAVTSSDPKVLTAVNTGMLTAPIGVTPGMFLGKAAGTVHLASQDASGKTWQVTVVVR